VIRSERLNSGAGSKSEVNVDLYALFHLILSPRARIRRYRWQRFGRTATSRRRSSF